LRLIGRLIIRRGTIIAAAAVLGVLMCLQAQLRAFERAQPKPQPMVPLRLRQLDARRSTRETSLLYHSRCVACKHIAVARTRYDRQSPVVRAAAGTEVFSQHYIQRTRVEPCKCESGCPSHPAPGSLVTPTHLEA
jgi:hypothetical protein